MSDSKEAPEPVDPKEGMRQALERKKKSQQQRDDQVEAEREMGGHAHGQAAGKRTFQRKSFG